MVIGTASGTPNPWRHETTHEDDAHPNGEIFFTLREATVLIEEWRVNYNTVRPHGALGYRPPAPEVIAPPAAQRDRCNVEAGTNSGGRSDAADDKWLAILSYALNFCMYGKDVAELKLDEIHLADRTLVANRARTGVTRVAMLWERTADVISKRLVFESPDLVLNQASAPFHADQIRRGFDRLRDRAGVSHDVRFADIRDGAHTVAVQGQEVEFEQARILAGHKTGMSDH